MTSPAQAPARRGGAHARRDGDERRPAQVAVVLAVVTVVNLLLWPTFSAGVNRSVGFAPGQSPSLIERMSQGSTNPTIRDTWNLHLRVGRLVGDEVLRLPAVQPLDPDLLAFVAGVETVAVDERAVTAEVVAAWPHEGVEEAVDEWGLRYRLFAGDSAGEGYRLLRHPTGEQADWLIVPEPWAQDAAVGARP